ncbi:hypothetical protein EFK50_14765 [Nocardioides marmoriginsengisoli]|uniref:Lipoprotein n=1 Tax=Nocardioides marmoriginsengisoli TaxID=661483 RepID=A0A3N0CHQ5_9ACTN|nr:hypothetical protein [Nocardioides marmoriginsengisoli]RNL62978.1 hypothetical protein EFK50_14765 [Nocardioides marmoriginsengisoli]
MRKMAIIAAGLLLGASLLSGCGGDDKDGNASSGKGYCDLLKASKDAISGGLSSTVPDAKAFEKFIKDAKTIADKAPSDVSDDWDVVNGKIKVLTDALSDAGLSIADLVGAAAAGKLPEGTTAAEFQALVEKIQAVGTDDFNAATKAIDENAKADCDLDLGMSSSS